jgi:selenium metabolism protein YedF
MKIDCRDLACPEPVINTKKSVKLLEDNGTLEVLVNSNASKENVIRFAKNEGLHVSDEITEDGSIKITIVKGFVCETTTSKSGEFLNKVLFIKDDKVGDNELGAMLIVGFLKTILELPELPKTVLCVNRAVFLTTQNSDAVEVLKELESRGVEIYSCGICLDFYKIGDELKVGKVGNAYATVEALLNSEGTITL